MFSCNAYVAFAYTKRRFANISGRPQMHYSLTQMAAFVAGGRRSHKISEKKKKVKWIALQ